jgi:dihydrodipicolinate synthase/N-acetylneuraminate lyase
MGHENVKGMLLPLPTPFDGDGGLDEGLLAEMAAYYVDRGVDSLFLFGSYGQGPAMAVEQRKRGLESIMKRVHGKIPIVVHIGAVDPYTSKELGLHARAEGADAVGIVGPYYYSDRSEAELMEHVRFLDDALKMPLFFYNNPKYQGYPVTPRMLRKMREVAPRLFGAKLAMGTIDDAMEYRTAMGPDFGLFVLASSLYPGLRCGITGTVSPPLTLAPDIGVALVRAVEQGKDLEAGRLQEAVIRFHAVFIRLGQSCGRAAYTEGLRHMGFPLKQYPRWPTPEIPEGAKLEIRKAIDEANAAVKSGS